MPTSFPELDAVEKAKSKPGAFPELDAVEKARKVGKATAGGSAFPELDAAEAASAPQDAPETPVRTSDWLLSKQGAKDLGLGLASGAAGVSTSLGQAGQFMGRMSGDPEFKDFGTGLRSVGERSEDWYRERMSETGRAPQTFGQKVAMGTAESLPGMVAMGLTSVPASVGLRALGVAEKVGAAAIKAGAGTKTATALGRLAVEGIPAGVNEGIFSGLQNAAQTGRQIRETPIEKLAGQAAFDEAFSKTDPRLDPQQRAELARESVAQEAEAYVAPRTAASTGGIGILTGGGVLGRIASTTRRGGLVSEVLKGMASEAGQEFAQSGPEQYIQNVATQKYVDEGQNLLEGVLESALVGAASGGILGGLGGGFHTASTPRENLNDAQVEADRQRGVAVLGALENTAGTPEQKAGIAAMREALAKADPDDVPTMVGVILESLKNVPRRTIDSSSTLTGVEQDAQLRNEIVQHLRGKSAEDKAAILSGLPRELHAELKKAAWSSEDSANEKRGEGLRAGVSESGLGDEASVSGMWDRAIRNAPRGLLSAVADYLALSSVPSGIAQDNGIQDIRTASDGREIQQAADSGLYQTEEVNQLAPEVTDVEQPAPTPAPSLAKVALENPEAGAAIIDEINRSGTTEGVKDAAEAAEAAIPLAETPAAAQTTAQATAGEARQPSPTPKQKPDRRPHPLKMSKPDLVAELAAAGVTKGPTGKLVKNMDKPTMARMVKEVRKQQKEAANAGTIESTTQVGEQPGRAEGAREEGATGIQQLQRRLEAARTPASEKVPDGAQVGDVANDEQVDESGAKYVVTKRRADGTEKKRYVQTRRWTNDYGKTQNDGLRQGDLWIEGAAEVVAHEDDDSAKGLTEEQTEEYVKQVVGPKGVIVGRRAKENGPDAPGAEADAAQRKGTPAARAATITEPAEGVDRYQWMADKEGGQKAGNQTSVMPLTEEIYQTLVLPKLRKGAPKTLAAYQKKYPGTTHVSLTRVEGQGEYQLDAVGTRESLTPKPEEPMWSRKVDSWDSPEAKKQGSTFDSEAPGQKPISEVAGEPITAPDVLPKLRKDIPKARDPRLIKAFADKEGVEWDDLMRVPKIPLTLKAKGRADLMEDTAREIKHKDGTKEYVQVKKTAVVPESSKLVEEGLLQPGTYSREVLHRAIIKYFTMTGIPRKAGTRQAYMSAGGGGAGKSHNLQHILGLDAEDRANGFVTINADDVKGLIPEFNEIVALGDGGAARIVHEESSYLAKQILDEALAMGSDLVYDATLSDYKKAEGLAKRMRENGYQIVIMAVTIDPYEAVIRAFKRAASKGRYVPVKALLEAHKGFNDAAQKYADLADTFVLIDNTPKEAIILHTKSAGRIEKAPDFVYDVLRERGNLNEDASTPEEIFRDRAGVSAPSVRDAGPAGPEDGSGGPGPGRGQREAPLGQERERGDGGVPGERGAGVADAAPAPAEPAVVPATTAKAADLANVSDDAFEKLVDDVVAEENAVPPTPAEEAKIRVKKTRAKLAKPKTEPSEKRVIPAKQGIPMRIFGEPVVLIDSTTQDGILYELFMGNKGMHPVRISDVDSGKVINISKYSKMDGPGGARDTYTTTIAKAASVSTETSGDVKSVKRGTKQGVTKLGVTPAVIHSYTVTMKDGNVIIVDATSREDAISAALAQQKRTAEMKPTVADEKASVRTAAEITESLKKNGIKGADEAMKALGELFGGPGRANMPLFIPVPDEDMYARAKPHLIASYQAFTAAGKDLKEFVQHLVQTFGAGIKPYLMRFKQDLLDLEKGVYSDTKESSNERRPIQDTEQPVGGVAEGQGRSPEGPEGSRVDALGTAQAEVLPAGEAEGEPRPAGGERGEGQPRDDAGGSQPGSEAVRGVGDDPGRPDTPAGRAVTPSPKGNDRGANYRITESDAIGAGGEVTKYKQNIEAIRILRRMEKSGRRATPEEQAALVKYVGWGGMPAVFNRTFDTAFEYEKDQAEGKTGRWGYHYDQIRRDEYNGVKDDPWYKRYKEIRELLSDEEFDRARTSVLNAHYTSAPVIRGMYKALARLGFRGGKMIEPSAGIGHFIGLQPDYDAATEWTAVELDTVTGAILKALYPESDVRVQGYEETALPNNWYDVAMSNVPFGDYRLTDAAYDENHFLIHDYFFAKSLDKVRPGGVVAFITSKGTLDKIDKGLIGYMDTHQGQFIGAIRLPNTAFKKNANTEVVTDIIFVKKVEAGTPVDNSAIRDNAEISAGGTKFRVNKYFVDHPEMVLGRWSNEGKMRRGQGEELTVAPGDVELDAAIAKAIEALPEGVFEERGAGPKLGTRRPAEPEMELAPSEVKEGNLGVDESGRPVEKIGGLWRPMTVKAPKAAAEVIKDMIPVRTALRQVLTVSMKPGPEGETDLAAAMKDLNKAYDRFVKRHGAMNGPRAKAVIVEDVDGPNLLALEDYNSDTKKAVKMPIFSQRVIAPPAPVHRAETIEDAVRVALHEGAVIDVPRIAQLLNVDEKEAERQLVGKNLAFVNPETHRYEDSGEYLSGYVRAKLKAAEEAAKVDPSFQRNVEALQKVQPADKTPEEISGKHGVNLGAPWVGIEDYGDFLRSMLGGSSDYWQIQHNTINGAWQITWIGPASQDGIKKGAKATREWGTNDYPAHRLMQTLMNQQTPRVMKPDPSDPERDILDPVATELAEQKADAMKKRFAAWLWEDEERKTRLHRVFNDRFNDTADRVFDGSGLTFPGMSEVWKGRMAEPERAFRLAGVARAILSGGNTLFAWAVGAGKTSAVASVAMEVRRMKLARKPLVAVPNSMIEQWAREFQEIYPNAKILRGDQRSLSKARRQEFLARVATGDWDAVIVPHSVFSKIGMSTEYQRKYLNEEIARVERAIIEADSAKRRADAANAEIRYGKKKKSKSDTRLVKQLEAMKQKLSDRLKKIMADQNKDKNLRFDELGVDYLFVDEAHNFKGVPIITKLRTPGIQQRESQRAMDLEMKTRYVTGLHQGRRGVVFATGTPISNSIAEMYVMMRYLNRAALERKGIDSFDDWVNLFGHVVRDTEVAPTGKGFRVKDRFAEFSNVGEMAQIWKQFADVVLSSDLKINRPTHKGNGIKAIEGKASNWTKKYIDSIVDRADKLFKDKVDPKVDNMLKITNEGRMVATDPRLIDPKQPDAPDSKVNKAVANILSEYKETAETKGAQLVFLDMGIPSKAKAKIQAAADAVEKETDEEAEEGGEEDADKAAEAFLAGASNFDLYADIKKKLIAGGMKPSEVAFIHDAETDEERAELFAKVRSGQIRVLIGNTPKMGEGINVQRNLVAIHHIDAPWKPAWLEQRNGRIFRSGNINKQVSEYRYATGGSFDAYMWQTIERKAGFIGQALKANRDTRVIEDIDTVALTAQEMKAIASGDPSVRELITQQHELSKLLRKRAAAEADVDRRRSAINSAREALKYRQRTAEEATKIEAAYQAAKAKDDKPALVLSDGRRIDDEDVMLRAVSKAADLIVHDPSHRTNYVELGTYFGLRVGVSDGSILRSGPQVVIMRDGTLDPVASVKDLFSDKPISLIRSLSGMAHQMPKIKADAIERVKSGQKELADFEATGSEGFSQDARIEELEASIGKLMAVMEPENDPAKTAATDALAAEEDEDAGPRERSLEEPDAEEEAGTGPEEAPEEKVESGPTLPPSFTRPKLKTHFSIRRAEQAFRATFGKESLDMVTQAIDTPTDRFLKINEDKQPVFPRDEWYAEMLGDLTEDFASDPNLKRTLPFENVADARRYINNWIFEKGGYTSEQEEVATRIAQRTAAAREAYDKAMEAKASGEPTFSAAKGERGVVLVEDAQRHVAPLLKRIQTPVQFIETLDDLSKEDRTKVDAALARQGLRVPPRGINLDGNLYVVASQLQTADEALEVVFHEVAENGFNAIRDGDVDEVLDDIFKGDVGRRNLVYQQAFARVRKNYPGISNPKDWRTRVGRAQFLREVLAHVAEKRAAMPSIWTRALNAVRTWLAKLFRGTRLERAFGEFRDAAIEHLVDRMLMAGARPAMAGAAAFSGKGQSEQDAKEQILHPEARRLIKNQGKAWKPATGEAWADRDAARFRELTSGTLTPDVRVEDEKYVTYKTPDDHEFIESKGLPGYPVIGGKWMDFWEPYMQEKHGISEAQYAKLPEEERAKIELRQQLDVYIPDQFSDNFARTYFPREWNAWWKKNGLQQNTEEQRQHWTAFLATRGYVERDGRFVHSSGAVQPSNSDIRFSASLDDESLPGSREAELIQELERIRGSLVNRAATTGFTFGKVEEKAKAETRAAKVRADFLARLAATRAKGTEVKRAAVKDATFAGYVAGKKKGRQEGQAEAMREGIKKAAIAVKEARADAVETLQNIKTQISEAINENLPMSERGRLVTALANAKTQDDVYKALVRVDEYAEEWQKKVLIASIGRELKRVSNAKNIAIDYVKQVHALMLPFVTRSPNPATIKKMKDLKDFIDRKEAAGEDVEVPAAVLAKLRLLTATPLADVPNQQLADLLGEIRTLTELGKTKLRARKHLDKMRKDRDKADILAGTTKPLNDRDLIRGEIGEGVGMIDGFRNMYRQAADKANHLWTYLQPMDVVFDMLDGMKGFEGAFHRIFKARTDKAFGQSLAEIRDVEDGFAAKVKEHKIGARELERIAVVAFNEQETGRQKLMENNGLTEAQIDAVVLEPNERAFLDWMRETMDAEFPAIQRVMREVYNQDVKKVNAYFPMQTDWSLTESEFIDGFMMDDTGKLVKTDEWLKKNPNKGFTIKRKGAGRQALKLNAGDVFLKHMRDVKYMVAMSPTTKYLGELAMTDAVREAAGDFGQRIIREYVDTLARRGSMPEGSFMRGLDLLRRNIGAATMGFKLTSIGIQPTALLNGAGVIGRWAFKGASDMASSKEWRQFVQKHMPEVRNRIGDDPSYVEFGGNWTMRKIREAGYWPLAKLDMLTASAVGIGAYQKYAHEHGLDIDFNNPDPKAIAYAERAVRRTQSSPYFKDVPLMVSRGKGFGSRSLAKAVLQFQNFTMNEFSLLTHEGLRSAIKNKKGMQAFNIWIWSVLSTMAVMGVRGGIEAIRNGLSGYDDDREKDAFLKRLLLEKLNVVPFMSQFMSVAAYDREPVPVADAVTTAVQSLGRFGQAESGLSKARAAVEGVAAVGKLTGIPGTVQAEQLAKDQLRRMRQDEEAGGERIYRPRAAPPGSIQPARPAAYRAFEQRIKSNRERAANRQ